MPEGTFKSYFYNEQTPPLPTFLRMCQHFGPRFASDVLQPAGLACIKASDTELLQSAELLTAIKQLIPVLEGVVTDARAAVKLKAVGEWNAVILWDEAEWP